MARGLATTSLMILASPEMESTSPSTNCANTTYEPNVLLLIFYIIYFILGVFGNGILVLLFLMKKHLRTINNALITNLAFSDFLFVILYAPIKFYEEFYKLRPYGHTFCHISVIINYTSQDVSTLTMMALSYLRYRAVRRPLKTAQDDQKPKCPILLYCGISYVVGIVASLFPARSCTVLTDPCWDLDRHYVDSYEYVKHHLAFHIVRCVFFYILPLIVITIFYSMITFKVCKAPSPLQWNESISARRAIRSRKTLGGIVLAIVVIFFLSWLPNYLAWFIGLQKGYFIRWMVTMRSICMFLPATLNPILLFVTSSRYRKSFHQIFSR